MKLIYACLAILTCLMLPSSALAAQSGGVFLLAPSSIKEMRADPGFSQAGRFTLYTLQPNRAYNISVLGGTQDENGSIKWSPQSSDPRDPSAWVQLSETRIEGGTRTRIPIVWTLNPPESAEPGDHLIAIAVTLELTEKEKQAKVNGTGALILERVASPVIFTLSGEQRFSPHISEISVPQISSDSTVPLSTTFKNRGNVRIDLEEANARLEVIVGGKVVESYDLEGTIYPGSTRAYEFTWDDAPALARGEARVSMDFRSQGHKRISEKADFYIIPFKIIGLILLILLGLIWLLVAARRNRKDDAAEEAAVISSPESASAEANHSTVSDASVDDSDTAIEDASDGTSGTDLR